MLGFELRDYKALVRRLLLRVGKSDSKVAVVFGRTPESCHTAVSYLHAETPEVPVFLFANTQPFPETFDLCKEVHVHQSAVATLLHAQRILWSFWVAISIGVWDGERGRWLTKWTPFSIPPFRVLLLNANGDFLPGSPRHVLRHAAQLARDGAREAWICLRSWGNGARAVLHFAGDLIRSAGRKVFHLSLLTASLLLRVCGNPQRRWFAHLHKERRLDLALALERTPATGVAVFTQAGEHWDGDALERFARSATARWILWQQPPAVEHNANELILPFGDVQAFAASHQPYFHAWKPVLLPTAPFRALQPGEASRVLAPLASAILVDRQKLLAVGIPRCSMPEVAWMLCFWKAAAAGWHSFSVGHDAPLCEQPDSPVHETAFLFHLLANSALRRLGPREPALSRGAISCMPAPRTLEISGPARLKVLLVSPFLPFPLSHGGAVRIYNLCRSLSSRVDFVLIALREKDETVEYARLKEVFHEVYVVDIDERESHQTHLPEQVRRSQSQPLRALIAEVAARWQPDLLQIEYTHMAPYRDCAPQVPALLVEHDLTFSLYRQLAQERPGQPARLEYDRWLEFERRWLEIYEGVWTVCHDDCRSAMQEGKRSLDYTFLVPNGVDLQRFTPVREASDVPEILYVGSFRHLPNVLGFENLLREIMPKVWARFPQARLRVVAGTEFERYWNGEPDPRVRIHGFVEDLRPLYARASVVVAPLAVSAGTNIKVLEAMACGKAVVTTPLGCAGLGLQDNIDARIHAEWPAFAASVVYLLGRPRESARLGANARRTVESRFSWEAIADGAYESYVVLSDPHIALRAAVAG